MMIKEPIKQVTVLPLSKKFWVTGLVLVGMVAGLSGPGADRAPAAPGKSDNLAEYSACVGAALADAGFEDVTGTSLESAVNCLSYYGITRGRSGDIFSPSETVTRWQMALFLARAARLAGITLAAAPADQGFTDLDELSADTRAHVNRVAQAGIMPATSPGHFDPNQPVTRESMAGILDAFLRRAVIGAGGTAPANVQPDDVAVFTDIGRVTRASYYAILRVYELGITRGVGGSRFAPYEPVTRGQMAHFITRTLGHTIARPAGVTVQAPSTGDDPVTVTELDIVQLAVTVRDADFNPMPNAPVDVFTFSGSAPFADDGSCVAGQVRNASGSRACQIDQNDERTDSVGFLSVEVEAEQTLTVRAWTGGPGNAYHADATQAGSLNINTVKEASQLLITDDLDDHQEKMHFGETITFTIQVADVNENPIPEENQAVTITQIVTGADGSSSQGARVYRTDGSGELQFSFTQNDPDAARDGPDASVVLIVGGTAFPVNDKTTNGTDADGRYQATWSDDPPVETTLDISQAKEFTPASDAGPGAPHLVTAVLTDQYGEPVRRKTVFFTSNDADGIGAAPDGSPRYQRVTNRSGTAVVSYLRDNDASGVETITALYRGANAADPSDDLSTERLYHYWTVEPDRGARFTARLVKADLENNQVALLSNEAWLISYDGNDQLRAPDGPTDLAGFEKALEEEQIAHIAVHSYADQERGVSALALRNRWPQLTIPDQAEHNDYAFVFASDKGVIVVGSPNDDVDSGGTVQQGAGAVYVYEGPNDATPARLTSSSPTGLGNFGYSVDVRGDVIAVGHPGGGGTGQGVVEVFTKPAGGWTDSDSSVVWHDLSNAVGPASSANYEFGRSVALSGDGTKMAAAAPGRKRAYLFTISGPDASNRDGSDVPVLVPADGSSYSSQLRRAFATGGPGAMLSISEDGSTVAAGAYSLPGASGAAEAGAVYVFTEPDGGWSATAANPSDAKLTDAEAERGEWLGWSVGVSADGSIVATGAHATDHQESRALIYARPAAGWADTGQPTTALAAPSGEPLSEGAEDFGQYVDISDDGRIIASSRAARPLDDDHLREPVHIFTRPAGGWTSSAPDSVQQLAPRRWIRFGWGTTIDHSSGQVLSAEAVVPHRIYLITP